MVTDKHYSMEKALKEKLDLMIGRMTGPNKKDNLVLIDGDEGDGKSNMAMGIAYYVHDQTKRPFTVDNVYFNLEDLTTKALAEKEQIYVWDEGALGGLAGDWWNKNQKKFIKLLMVARKRRHFFIICIPKFFKLNEYLVLDRSIALIHVYLRNGIHHGRFVYFSKSAKEKLYYDWRKSRFRNYAKYYNLRGTFGEVLPLVIDEAEYDRKKDLAILSIDKDDDVKDERTIRKNLQIIWTKRMITLGILPKSEVLKDLLGITVQNARIYIREAKKLLEKESEQQNIIITNGTSNEQFMSGLRKSIETKPLNSSDDLEVDGYKEESEV